MSWNWLTDLTAEPRALGRIYLLRSLFLRSYQDPLVWRGDSAFTSYLPLSHLHSLTSIPSEEMLADEKLHFSVLKIEKKSIVF